MIRVCLRAIKFNLYLAVYVSLKFQAWFNFELKQAITLSAHHAPILIHYSIFFVKKSEKVASVNAITQRLLNSKKNIILYFVLTYPVVCITFCCQNFMQQLYIVILYYIFFMAYVVLHLVLLQVEKEKSLQIFVLQFVETFRDWGPQPIEQLDDQELGSDKTVVGCSCGHPSEVILILIQEISLITSTIVESK